MSAKSTYQPPYTITPEILNRVAAISEAIGRLTVLTDQARVLRLRRSVAPAHPCARDIHDIHVINRIRTIHGSLAIEGNSLSEAQITAILEGKRVIAPPREVQE
jgi:Fic family protein